MAIDHGPDPTHHPDPGGRLDDVDATVLRRLASAWTRRDPLPVNLVAGVTFAVALDEVYAEVAQIQRQDSRRSVAGVRGAVAADAEAPGMSFASSDLTLTIMTSPSGRHTIRIDGWITPDDGGAVGLRLPDETRRHVPRQGRFWFDDVPRGHVQLFVEAADGQVRLITPAVEF